METSRDDKQQGEHFTIISGGQTGVDRVALDVAIELNIPHAGWCPLGRMAEDGPLDRKYNLRETPTSKYDERTRWNVRDSDATVVFNIGKAPTGGTALTWDFAKNIGKPTLFLAQDSMPVSTAAALLKTFITEHAVKRLNVAGPRQSQNPEAAAFAKEVLMGILRKTK